MTFLNITQLAVYLYLLCYSINCKTEFKYGYFSKIFQVII